MSAQTGDNALTRISIARMTRRSAVLVSALVAICVGMSGVNAASAAAGPALSMSSSLPDYVTPGQGLVIFASVKDVGDAP